MDMHNSIVMNRYVCGHVEINDLVVDGDFDILLMMETWLYASGDEAYITEMTPSGYLFHTFPRIGHRGGGIAIMFKSLQSDSISMHPLPFNSFESVELRLSNDNTSVLVICLYRPPPSKQNKLSNKMFFEEFSMLVSEYSHACRDLAFIVEVALLSELEFKHQVTTARGGGREAGEGA